MQLLCVCVRARECLRERVCALSPCSLSGFAAGSADAACISDAESAARGQSLFREGWAPAGSRYVRKSVGPSALRAGGELLD